MTAFRHIVVGLDTHPRRGALSTGSVAALASARWLARGESVRCTLLHSSASDELWNPSDAEHVASETAVSAEAALEAAAHGLREAGIATEVEISEERAWLAIIRRVIEASADLVLVGKRSEAERGGPHVGSVAAKLLRKCPCAVWAARPGSEMPPRSLLAAVDASRVAERVLQRASQIAQRADAELHVLHAFQLTMAAQLTADPRDYVEQQTAAATRRIRASLAQLGHSGKLELHVGVDSPTRAILAGVKRHAVDLVVMATISRGGLAGLLLGNTAERILQRLDASLLTVKPADFVCPIEVDRAI